MRNGVRILLVPVEADVGWKGFYTFLRVSVAGRIVDLSKLGVGVAKET